MGIFKEYTLNKEYWSFREVSHRVSGLLGGDPICLDLGGNGPRARSPSLHGMVGEAGEGLTEPSGAVEDLLGHHSMACCDGFA